MKASLLSLVIFIFLVGCSSPESKLQAEVEAKFALERAVATVIAGQPTPTPYYAIVEKEVIKEVEKIIEVEVEKIVEVIVEVEVEKIVEVMLIATPTPPALMKAFSSSISPTSVVSGQVHTIRWSFFNNYNRPVILETAHLINSNGIPVSKISPIEIENIWGTGLIQVNDSFTIESSFDTSFYTKQEVSTFMTRWEIMTEDNQSIICTFSQTSGGCSHY